MDFRQLANGAGLAIYYRWRGLKVGRVYKRFIGAEDANGYRVRATDDAAAMIIKHSLQPRHVSK